MSAVPSSRFSVFAWLSVLVSDFFHIAAILSVAIGLVFELRFALGETLQQGNLASPGDHGLCRIASPALAGGNIRSNATLGPDLRAGSNSDMPDRPTLA